MALVAASRFKPTDSQPDLSNVGPVSIDLHDFHDLCEKLSWHPDPLFILFSAQSSESRLFVFFGRDKKDVRRKVTQIRGGITSGSAFFDCFRLI